MKQTAVEWLAIEINGVDTAVAYHYFKEKVKQAKEMEDSQATEYAKWSMDISQLTGRFFTFREWIKDEPKNDDNL